jgi:hypothetical protein
MPNAQCPVLKAKAQCLKVVDMGRVSWTACIWHWTLSLIVVGAASAAELTVVAPPTLEPFAARVRAVDLLRLDDELSRAGLAMPARVMVTLIAEDDPRARATPRWIVGFAYGEVEVTIFPERVLPYPYESVESVFRHEVAHLALASRAGGRPLPRWFHEGVAMSVDAGWNVSGRVRLLLEMVKGPGTAELTRLFASDTEPDAAQAYGLSAALVADVQRRHGAAVPGAVAARVANGEPFVRAFELETGETPDAAATHAWSSYRRWTAWVPALTNATALWSAILALAATAYMVRRRTRARRRRQWDQEEKASWDDEGI